MNQKPLTWVVVAIAVLVLVPLLSMIGMMGTGMGMMGGGIQCCAGMGAMGLVWMLALAALIVAAIILLIRSVSRS